MTTPPPVSGTPPKFPRYKRGGQSRSPEYKIWESMKRRCLRPADKDYRKWGGRGITICERWMTFKNFLADMGKRPIGRSIDRINNNGNYEPGNCRWATPKMQCENSRHAKLTTFDGKTLTLLEWSRSLGLSRSTVSRRLKTGWSIEEALTRRSSEGCRECGSLKSHFGHCSKRKRALSREPREQPNDRSD